MNDFIYDVTELDFEEKIVEVSNNKAVVVDFWAEWCAPCKMLGPVIEKVVQSFGGRVVLAKVNVDQNPQLAAAFGIRSIPSVKILRNSSIVKEFVGALPEDKIRALIEPFAGEPEPENNELTPEQLMAEKRYAEARSLFTAMLENEDDSSRAHVGLARIDIIDGEIASAKKHLTSVDELTPEYEDVKNLTVQIAFKEVCDAVQDKEALQRQFKENPSDLDSGYRLGCCFAAEGSYKKALDTFLAIIKKNVNFGDGKAREAMVAIFGIIGHDSPITQDYRQRLANALF